MNTRMVVLYAVLAAMVVLAIAVSRAVVLHNAPPEQTTVPARVSHAGVKEGLDVKLISELSPKISPAPPPLSIALLPRALR